MGGVTVPHDLIAPGNQSDPLIQLSALLEADELIKALRVAAK